jgi:hypothetical protein
MTGNINTNSSRGMRIVKGNPDDLEIAAVVCALSALISSRQTVSTAALISANATTWRDADTARSPGWRQISTEAAMRH